MPQLLAIAEYITKTLAICVVCGAPASRTQRNRAEGGRVVVGGAGLYEARCRRCHTVPEEAQAVGTAAASSGSGEPGGPEEA
jgi:thymidine kinase